MLIDILSHTPVWVYVLFLLLAWLGGRQLQPSSPHLLRAVGLPVAMIAFAAYGVINAFGQSSTGLWVLLAWAAAALAVGAVVSRMPLHQAVRYDAFSRRFYLPGSWVPLGLMMGIFLTKYVVAVLLAMHPDWAYQARFAFAISALYGLFSGVFAGRALRLLSLAKRGAMVAI